MPNTDNGLRPRPRVGLAGNFEQNTIDSLKLLFPTVWLADSPKELLQIVDPNELDLVIFANDVSQYFSRLFSKGVSVISFSASAQLNWPNSDIHFVSSLNCATTEQYSLPDLPLGFGRLRETNLSGIETIKGWNLLQLRSNRLSSIDAYNKASKVLLDSAIIFDPFTQLPFAFIYQSAKTKQGLACLPNPVFQISPWVELICTEWAKTNTESFPNFGDWMKNPEWTTQREFQLNAKIDNLEIEKQQVITRINQEINSLQEELIIESAAAKSGLRRLITAQGDELVSEVSSCLSKLGFIVTKMDEKIAAGSPKLEDLRIQDPNDSAWEAIVEVRGYSKSGGVTSDFNRLARFSRFYRDEKACYPSKQIYIVNGQIDLPPSQRQPPLISSPDDINEFGEQDGIVIWSLDLFRLIKDVNRIDLQRARNAIKTTKGRFFL
jgi:hypothetical protein